MGKGARSSRRRRLPRGRGLVLIALITVFAAGIALDHYLQTKARLPRGELRRQGPAASAARSSSGKTAANKGPHSRGSKPSKLRFDPDAGTELTVRIGGTRIPDLPKGAFGIAPPEARDGDSRADRSRSGGTKREDPVAAPSGQERSGQERSGRGNGAPDPDRRTPERRTPERPGPPDDEPDAATAGSRDTPPGEATRGSTPFETERLHRVRPNETLSEIALEYGLQGPDGWRRIQELNQIEDPTQLRAGDEIRIPPPRPPR